MEMQWLWPAFTFEEDEGAGSGKADESGAGDSGKETKDDKDEKPSKSDKRKSRQQELEDENNRLKREAAERSEKDRKAESKRLKEAGEHEKRADAAEGRVAELESELTSIRRDSMVEKAAKAQGMEFPEDASRLLTEDEMKDERAAEAGIRRLKEERPKLFGEVRQSGADISGNDDEGREGERDRVNRAQARGDLDSGLTRLRSVQRKS